MCSEAFVLSTLLWQICSDKSTPQDILWQVCFVQSAQRNQLYEICCENKKREKSAFRNQLSEICSIMGTLSDRFFCFVFYNNKLRVLNTAQHLFVCPRYIFCYTTWVRMTSSAFRRNFSADFGAEGFAFRRTICGDCLGCSRWGWSAQQIGFSATHLWRHTWRLATGIMRGSGAKDGWVAGDENDARGFEDQTALRHRDWPMVVVDFLLIQNYFFRSNSAPA